ncbi:hypothetical protein WJ968_32150 [Achromobacter xylosoxidans]
MFGAYRLNEVELARHFGVGRTAARDVLLRLEGLGLVGKDERQRWIVTPLDERRIRNLYQLRWLLEPAALAGALADVSAEDTAAMAQRLRRAKARYPRLTRAELDELEHDLHVALIVLLSQRQHRRKPAAHALRPDAEQACAGRCRAHA